jgi:hypothetical protein
MCGLTSKTLRLTSHVAAHATLHTIFAGSLLDLMTRNRLNKITRANVIAAFVILFRTNFTTAQ